MENKEYYIVYIDELGLELSLYIGARTAREALSGFLGKNVKYNKITKVIEWVSNNLQVTHQVKNNEIITT